ncbi:paraquat-inducible protein A [Balneatrix alpica]|uniref:Paraquat-inducible protein A n=1 Tax=Balneatrix alpica TaxID=75684 RepID=A0ABV5Z851_9GAMM|nr:paraquat-inducible protein A [Balneatrix alpica]
MHEALLCHECDALVDLPELQPGQDAFCPHCGAHLASARPDTLRQTLALALAGLLLYVPANLLPLLSMDVMGQHRQVTLWEAVLALYQNGAWVAAGLVLLCSMLVPLLELWILFQVSLLLLLKQRWGVRTLFAAWYWLRDWGMLEVYMISILVSMVKLLDMAQIHIGLGLYTFAAMLLVALLIGLTCDPHEIWQRLEALDD